MSPTLEDRSNTKARSRKAGQRTKKPQSAKANRSAREQISELTAAAGSVEALEQEPAQFASDLATPDFTPSDDFSLPDQEVSAEAASEEALSEQPSAMTGAHDEASVVIDVPLDSPVSQAPAESAGFSEPVSVSAGDARGVTEATHPGGSRKVPLVAARMLDQAIEVQTEYAKQVCANFFETPLILCKLYSGVSRRMLTSWQIPLATWRS